MGRVELEDNKPLLTVEYGRKVSFEVVLSMNEETLFLYLAFFSMCVYVWLSNARLKDTLTALADDLKDRLNDDPTLPEGLIDTLKDSMLDIVEDTLQNMQPPTAGDHLMGTISQLIQMKVMRNMGLQNMLSGATAQEVETHE